MDLQIVKNEEVAPGFFRMAFLAPDLLKKGRPGQFVMLRGNWEDDPLLRRPFSVYRYHPNRDFIEIAYRVVGRGTKLLSGLHRGDRVDVVGPLGNGFLPLVPNRRYILAAGGIGIAPLMSVAETSQRNIILIMGGKSEEEVSHIDSDVSELGIETIFATEDGGRGVCGTTVLALREIVTRDDIVLACGPRMMLKEIFELSLESGFETFVSYEEQMACGIGVCLGCAAKGREGGYLLTCADGPIFHIADIAWDDVHRGR